jgi:hypothetical protein
LGFELSKPKEADEVSLNSMGKFTENWKKRVVSAGGVKKNDQNLIQRLLSNLCHSIATNEEMAFEVDLRRLTNIIDDLKGANKN